MRSPWTGRNVDRTVKSEALQGVAAITLNIYVREDTMVRIWRWCLWLTALAVLTFALVMPVPAPETLPLGEWITPQKFLLAKSVHVAAYAVLTIGAAWLEAPLSWRWGLPVFLVLHGAATEWIQSHLPYREGTVRDVLFDAAGVLLGCLLTWRHWRG
jgi:VanZ family protein